MNATAARSRPLGAVESGRAHQVDDDVFFTGIGLTAADRILDDLADLLA